MSRGKVWDEDLGGVRLLSVMCQTCIFRGGNPMRLSRGRLAQMVADTRRAEGYIICHDTLAYGAHPDAGEALCRGFFDRYSTAFTQVMGRLGAFREVAPPGGPR